MAESKGDPSADCHNCAGVTEWSKGIFQINVDAHPQWASLNLYDPTINARIAYQLWQANGWNPWTTYTRGTYRKYLGQCQGSGQGSAPASPTPTVASAGLLVAALIAGYLILDWL